jgi:hypothetical protein
MKFEGEVRELDLIPALVELGAEGFTGALRFENDSIIKIVYFKGGSVLSASTNDRLDSIDEILLKSGKVTRDHVKQALSKRKDEETLGDALLGLGFITRKELSWARRVQLVGILRSITTWDSGTYTLVADYLPKREEGPVFQLEQIVLELVLTDGNRAKYDTLLDSGNVVFRPAAVFESRFPRLGLNQEAEAVVRLIDGSRTASEVVSESTSDAFNVYKLMHALHLLGLLDKSAGSFADAGFGGGEAEAQGTIEMPMDFGGPLAEPSPAVSFDLETGDSSASADLSWQMPAEPEASPVAPDLPSIGATVRAEQTSAYEYEPSVPVVRMPTPEMGGDVSSVESLGRLEVPEPSVPSEPEPVPLPLRKPVVAPPRGPAGGTSGGRKLAFLVVGIVILAALGYAGFVYLTGSSEAPVPQASVTPPVEPAATPSQPAGEPTGEEAATDVPATPPDTTLQARPETAQPPVETSRPTPPPPAPVTQPAPTPTGRFADVARQNARAAASVPFTVQFALLCQESSVENAMRVGGGEFWFVPIDYQGRSCYRAFWGRYETRAEAERGAGTIPTALRGGKAVVVEPAKLSN